ncbi:hypothetical protein FE257_007180 [Aspergillus nanangensis]|uniref:Histidine-specific methyltransferase SAM-dependent domain-containing protein n=1 Tax=Aspergillus nanangensis TaxID=2582783 RepID=A0AAD4CNP5_ASPNN|nr:hypothetical protein FE257_007180 [Aspergillus nanangensis]
MTVTPFFTVGDHQIFDIRQDIENVQLRNNIIDGLSPYPASLPSSLLWTAPGLRLFDRFSQTPSYYPFHSEIEILQQSAAEIADGVPAGAVLIELGCGTIRKTKLILSAFEQQKKPIHYYALDMSREGLTDSIRGLSWAACGSPHVRITGLWGTYEDGISWLARPDSLKETTSGAIDSVVFLWLGNSIANFPCFQEASAFLACCRRACELSQRSCQFLLSTDICQNPSLIDEAYSVARPEYRAFLRQGLTAANRALGRLTFDLADWECGSLYNADDYRLDFFYTPIRDLDVVTDDGPPQRFQKGDRVQIVSSGKWPEQVVEQLCIRAGFHVQQRWKDGLDAYCFFSALSFPSTA